MIILDDDHHDRFLDGRRFAKAAVQYSIEKAQRDVDALLEARAI
jgi:hypothetical protein